MANDFFMFPGGEIPPEVAARMREQQEHHHLHLTDNTHAIKQLFDGLDEDQLRSLDLLLSNCDDQRTLMFFRGRIEMLQQIKFDICPCGTDHDAELANLGGQDKPHGQPNTTIEHKGRPVEDVDLPTLADKDELNEHTTDTHSLMAEYGVESNPLHGKSHAPEGASPFRCTGCGVGIASLQDRMLRPPGIEGCSGCQQRSAWG